MTGTINLSGMNRIPSTGILDTSLVLIRTGSQDYSSTVRDLKDFLLIADTSPQPSPVLGGLVDERGYYAEVNLPDNIIPDTYNFDDCFVVVQGSGFDENGVSVSASYKLPITTTLYKAYPNQEERDVSLTSRGLTLKLVFNRQVAAGDKVFLILPALWLDGDSEDKKTNLSTYLEIVNGSSESQTSPTARFISTDRQVIRDDTFDVEVASYHYSGKNRKPVASVRFTATGQSSGNVVSVVTSEAENLARSGDYGVSLGYKATFNKSDFDQGEVVTVDAEVFPTFGKSLSSSTADTRIGFSTQNYRMSGGSYIPLYAAVSSSGVDVSGVVSESATTAEATPFYTVAEAWRAIQAAYELPPYNRVNADATGGVIRVIGTDNIWSRESFAGTYIRANECMVVIEPSTGQDNITAGFNNLGDRITRNNNVPVKIHLNGVKLAPSASDTTIFGNHGADYLYFIDNCNIDQTSQTSKVLAQGRFEARYHGGTFTNTANLFEVNAVSSTGHLGFTLVRGVDSEDSGVWSNCVIGSRLQECGLATSRVVASVEYDMPEFDNTIVAHTHLTRTNQVVANFAKEDSLPNEQRHGISLIDSCFEQLSATTSPTLQISADGTETSTRNITLNGVTVRGQRFNGPYVDNGDQNFNHDFFEMRGCLFETSTNLKDGSFGTPNPIRTGNWPTLHACGLSDIRKGEIFTFEPKVTPPNSNDTDILDLGFTGATGFDVSSGSVVEGVVSSSVSMSPYDINGNLRPVGAPTTAGCAEPL